jgi:hypothetical protein
LTSATSFICRGQPAGSGWWKTHLAKHHGGDLLRGEGLLLAQVVNLHDRVAIAVDDLEGPRLDVLLDGLVVEAATNEAPDRLAGISTNAVSILDVEDGVGGVHGGLVLGRLANEALLGGEGHEGRGGEVSLFIGD